jgi:hypothetical protein
MAYDAHGPNPVSTLYVNQPLNLPSLTAQAAFDTVRQACALTGAPDRWVIETAGSELCMEGTGVVNRRGIWALRQARGQLRRRGRLGSIAIDVGLTRWSKHRCEIGIRPCARMAPMIDGGRQRRYLALAVEAAEEVAVRLEAQVHDWMYKQWCAPTGNPALLTGHRS